jgi:hypothetical protein
MEESCYEPSIRIHASGSEDGVAVGVWCPVFMNVQSSVMRFGVVEMIGVLSRKCTEDSNAKEGGNDCGIGVSIPDAFDAGVGGVGVGVISRC